jgi:hypothetical protein
VGHAQMKHSVAETVKLCWLVLKRNEQWVCKDIRLQIVRSLKKEMYNELFEKTNAPVVGSWLWWTYAEQSHIEQRGRLVYVNLKLKQCVERWRPYYQNTSVERLHRMKKGTWEWVGFQRKKNKVNCLM